MKFNDVALLSNSGNFWQNQKLLIVHQVVNSFMTGMHLQKMKQVELCYRYQNMMLN